MYGLSEFYHILTRSRVDDVDPMVVVDVSKVGRVVEILRRRCLRG